MSEILTKRQAEIQRLVDQKLTSRAIAAELGLTVGTVSAQKARIRIRLESRPLTKREIEIVELIGKGLSDIEISATLHISARTVEVHRQSVITKYKARNTPHLLALLHEQATKALLARISELEAIIADLRNEGRETQPTS
jgi:DNA-binding CsgD family transcriptional regulator